MMNSKLEQIPTVVSKEVEERISQIQSKLMKTMEVEKELMEFEILYSLLIKPQKKVHDLIKKERAKAWQVALKRAKGSREKAIEIFDEIYLK
ncbi:hypothetical protein HY837_01470 [archaeon]|nr:hypothetical protein [archaeon]